MPRASYIVSDMSASDRADLVIDDRDWVGDGAQAGMGNFEDGENGHGGQLGKRQRAVKRHGRRARIACASVPSSR